MFEKWLNFARSRSREEWHELVRERFINARIFAQENGEKVFLVGLLLGVIVVLFYKVFILAAALVALSYLLIIVSTDR